MKGDGSLYRRGRIWWMSFSRNGRAYCMSTGTTVKEEAKNKLRDEIHKSKTHEWLPPDARRVTIGELFSDLLEWYRTYAGKQDFADDVESRWNIHLKDTFENLRADAFGSTHQLRYRENRKKEGASDTTVNRELEFIRRAYKIASQAEPPKVSRVPKFFMVKEDNARKVFIDSEMQDRIRRAAAERGLWQRVLVEMAFTYGWRRGELEGLCVRNVNVIDGVIRIDRTKNGEPREVPITPGLSVLLSALVHGRPADAKLFEANNVHWEWTKICEAAGVKTGKKSGGIVFHDIRRSSARNKRAAGVDTSIIMKLQGWKTDAMFRRYALVDRVDMLRALELEQSTTVPLQLPPKTHAN